MSARDTAILLAALAGCDGADPEVAAICEGDEAVQLIITTTALERFDVSPARGHTMLFLGEHERVATHVGEDCGAKPVLVADGAHMRAARGHLDPLKDDASLACLLSASRLFQLDLTGRAPPRLYLPQVSCSLALPTAAGVLAPDEPYIYGSAWSHYPSFPSSSGVVSLGRLAGFGPQVRGTTAYFMRDSALHVYDLERGTSSALLQGIADFVVSDTHVLWRAATDLPVAPMHLRDLATGVDLPLGDFDPAIDHASLGKVPGQPWSWSFDPAASHVLHVPRDPDSPREAFDLRGNILPLPLPGDAFKTLASGHVLTRDPATLEVFAARPGDPTPARLDHPILEDTPQRLVVVDDHLESVFLDALHEVPLDGGPARVLVERVGVDRHWFDDHHLVTIFAGTLITIDTATGTRTTHGEHVTHMQVAHDDRGAYFNVAAAPGDRANGLWYLPRSALDSDHPAE